MQKRKDNLYIVLASIFLCNAILAEIIGVKIFSGEKLLAISAGDLPFSITYTAGVIIWPVVFITSDIINEYFGQVGVRRISYITAILISYAFIGIYTATLLPPADFWLEINKGKDGLFDINLAFSSIFRQGLGIIIGSIVAFLIGQILDAYIFHKLKVFSQNKKLWLRATGSTIISQLVDSFVVLFIAFYVFGNWSINQIVEVALNNYIYKFVVAIALTPVIYLAHKLIDRYLGLNNHNDNLANKAI